MAEAYHTQFNQEDEELSRNRLIYQQLLFENSCGSQQQQECYDPEVFIDEIHNFPSLWNTSTRSHHDQNIRMNCWEKLSQKFGKPGS